MNLLSSVTRIACFAILLTFFAGCGNPAKDILGEWERGEEILEFVEEGSWYSHSPHNTLGTNWGTWEINKEGLLVMRYANPPLPAYEREHTFEVSKKELLIKDYDKLTPKKTAPDAPKEPSKEVQYKFTRLKKAESN